jgi:predicted Ser/Thr protein kinase
MTEDDLTMREIAITCWILDHYGIEYSREEIDTITHKLLKMSKKILGINEEEISHCEHSGISWKKDH